MRILPLTFLFALACTLNGAGPDLKDKQRNGDSGVQTTTNSTTTSSTSTTTDPFNCDEPPTAPPFDTVSYPIQTQEDFDFSLGGYLIYQSGIAVVGTNKLAEETVLSAGTAGDPRGVHGLSDGRIVIMSPWDGAIKIADPSTGGLVVLAGSLNIPNGVEVDMNGRIYFTSYGEVGWTEPDGSANDVIYEWPNSASSPNGTFLSEDEQRLTVAVPKTDASTDFVSFDRTGPDTWGEPWVLYTAPGFFSTIDGDVCGNIYTVEYNSGKVYRIAQDGTGELLATLDRNGPWGFSAMRFGPGQNDWERDHLYISLRNTKVFDMDIGMTGRRHPTTP